jgi:two-component system response regulator RegX3
VSSQVVIVEDREQARVAPLLVREGLDIEACGRSLDVVVKTIQIEAPDLVMIEVSSAAPWVVRTCTAVAAATRSPIAVLYERGGESDVVDLYAAGASSVISEPVGSHELVARVRALLRRAPSRDKATADVTAVGPVTLDRARRQLSVNGLPVALPRKEFEIAELLITNAGSVVSRARLVRDLWGSARDTKTLDVQVGRLRAKLTNAEGRQRIVTVRGVGYRFLADDFDEAPVDLDERAPSPIST